MATDNRPLGKFDLTGLPAAPRGVPQIEVEFNIDSNGILNVTATDKATSKKQEIKISGSSGISKADIEKMKQEAEANAEADKARRESVDLRNQAEQIVYATKKTLADLGDKVPAPLRSSVESAISNLEEREKALEALNVASMELGKISYESTKAEGAAAGASPDGGDKASKGKDDVIDAEYEVKDN
jgi:molecular chaperone DnaK